MAGTAALLRSILETNNLGHPLCNHLRQGLWLLDYYVNRIDWYGTGNRRYGPVKRSKEGARVC